MYSFWYYIPPISIVRNGGIDLKVRSSSKTFNFISHLVYFQHFPRNHEMFLFTPLICFSVHLVFAGFDKSSCKEKFGKYHIQFVEFEQFITHNTPTRLITVLTQELNPLNINVSLPMHSDLPKCVFPKALQR